MYGFYLQPKVPRLSILQENVTAVDWQPVIPPKRDHKLVSQTQIKAAFLKHVHSRKKQTCAELCAALCGQFKRYVYMNRVYARCFTLVVWYECC